LWFGALERNAAGLIAFMRRYDPQIALDAAFFRKAMAFTFLHEFGTDILAMTLKQLHNPRVASIQELQALLWRR
jgi:hypothetical protein